MPQTAIWWPGSLLTSFAAISPFLAPGLRFSRIDRGFRYWEWVPFHDLRIAEEECSCARPPMEGRNVLRPGHRGGKTAAYLEF